LPAKNSGRGSFPEEIRHLQPDLARCSGCFHSLFLAVFGRKQQISYEIPNPSDLCVFLYTISAQVSMDLK
jgi:hypothetical protein